MAYVPPKRKMVMAHTKFTFEQEINALSDTGYTMEYFAYVPVDDIHEETFVMVAKLKEDPTIQLNGMLDIMDVPISKAEENRPFGSPLVQKAIAEGWSGGALFSGKVTMVQRKKEGEK